MRRFVVVLGSLATDEMIDAKFKLSLMLKADNTPTITFRNISWNRYEFEYDSELAWIRFKDGSRLIYTK